MIRICLLVIVACYCTPCFAQQQLLDSLLQVLQRHNNPDTQRVAILNDIAYEYSRIDPEKGLLAAEEAIKLASSLKAQNKLASAYSYKAMNLAGLGEDSVALTFYKRALAIHEQQGNTSRMGSTYNNIAITLVNLSSYQQALVHHQKAYAIFEKLGDSVRMGNSLNNRGVIYLYLSNYRQSLDLHLQALRIFERLQMKAVTATTLVNIGLVYNHLSDLDKSLKYQQDAFDLYKAAGDKQGMINTLGNIGNVYHDLDKNSDALSYYEKALALSKEMGDKRGISSNISNIGIVFSSLGNYANALANFETSLKMNIQAGDKKRIAADLQEIGKIYLHGSDSLLRTRGIKNRFHAIYDHESRSLELAEEIGSLDVQREAWNILSQAYETRGQHAKALNAYKKYILLRDSIINNEIKRDIDKKEIAFEFELREMKLKASQAQIHAEALATISRQRVVRNSIIAIATMILVTGVITFIFYKRKRDANEKQKMTEFRLSQLENEMDLLLLQMNPHFIFNSLNSINHYIDQNEKDKSTLYTTKFARLMRMTLENSRKKEISLSSDLELLQLYLELESLRLRHAFTWEIKVGDTVDPDQVYVPTMLLQPFVENSIWHGVTGKAGGRICIEVKKQGSMICYIVEDNGRGRYAHKDQHAGEGRQMGIQITSKRIELLNKLKNMNGSLQLTDPDEGLRVEIVLPL